MTIDRRGLVFGAGSIAALGLAEYLRPRGVLRLLSPDSKLTALLPLRMSQWAAGTNGDIVIPKTPGSLADRLYGDQVARTYQRSDSAGAPIMLLAAYGNSQSDTLQVHRPEVCYPAIGMVIVARKLARLTLSPGIELPVVLLTAHADSRTEDIMYWTRLGQSLPQTGVEQGAARLYGAMHGYVADGILVRASAVRELDGGVPQFKYLSLFLRELIMATTASARPALIGTRLSSALSIAQPTKS